MAFTIKDMGRAQYFLGLEFYHSPAGLIVSQHKYTDIIRDIGLASCKPAKTPLPWTSGVASSLPELTRLILLLGQQLSQYVHQPGQEHMDAALHLVRYLTGDPKQGIFFLRSNSPHLTAFCDADWKCKKQSTVARSTVEAEYRSLAITVCELQWITYLLHDLQVSPPTPIHVYCDNQAAIHIAANPVFHE
ncbi:UNVERIFIED_CONTAM: Retrovirus-related Pol polyprotein from transposon RE2 [Sesamum latifolium]|uniref:Retrovirus-related Pol polyprotein from transposon RE2 n=1 Tax=Sesamum latifolium TaxID=2727402 RepID=A0AAW2Y8K8_9LAMI